MSLHPNPGANQGVALPMPPYNMPLIDQRSGQMSAAWQGWFQVLFNRVGGLSAPPINLLPTSASYLPSQYIPTTQAVIYTSPGSLATILDSFQIQNKSSGAVTVSCWIVPPGGTAQSVGSGANIAINNNSVAANSTQNFQGLNGTIVPGGGMLVFQASVANALQTVILARTAPP